MTQARILIIGAGLGGLVAALALHKRGFAVAVHEQASRLGEAGAGLTISRGTQKVFRALGLMEAIAPFACPSANFPFLHYRSARVLSGELNHGDGTADDGIADVSRQMHRADLHQVLVEALQARAPGSISLGHELREIEQAASKVRAVFRNGDTAEGDALIGADGVKSRTRALLWGEDTPRFTGQLAYRFLVGRAQAAPFMGLGRGAVFLGPGATFNRYTLRGGSVVNGVAIVAHAAWSDDGWSTPVTREEMLDKFANWHPDVTGLMGQADSSIKWGLFDRAPLPRWRRNHATLLGDAAHAMLPFLGMGAAMAIEDGYVVARAMAAAPTIDAGLDLYEETRRPRTELLHAKSLEQGRLTQDRDPNYYDAAAAPASDQAIFGFDPVTAPLLGNVL